MTITFSALIALGIFILGLIYKAILNHIQTKKLNENDKEKTKRIGDLETEQLKITEALDRTFAPKEFVYEVFITRKEHNESLERLEEKLVIQMTHMNEALKNTNSTLEKMLAVIENIRSNQK
jgi:cell division protein FtsI/penicillin-binding protein 2